MKAQIIGVVVKTSKLGNVGSIIYFSCPASDYERSSADFCSGTVCRNEYIRGDYSALSEGQKVDLQFEPGFKGKASLADIVPL